MFSVFVSGSNSTLQGKALGFEFSPGCGSFSWGWGLLWDCVSISPTSLDVIFFFAWSAQILWRVFFFGGNCSMYSCRLSFCGRRWIQDLPMSPSWIRTLYLSSCKNIFSDFILSAYCCATFSNIYAWFLYASLKINSGKAFLGHVLQHKGVTSRNRVPLLALWGVQAGYSHDVRVGAACGWTEGMVQLACPPHGVAVYRGHA